MQYLLAVPTVMALTAILGVTALQNPSEKKSNYTVTDEAWFTVRIKDSPERGQQFEGTFTIALFGEVAPITVMNFVAITEGYRKGAGKLHYKGTPVHRIVPDFIIQMGDITVGDGTGGKSIYAPKFNDEEFVLSHQGPGWVAMANHGPDTNGSQFYILLQKARWLDGRHVVFGKVITGYNVIKTIGDVESDKATAKPKKKITIVDCGLNKLEKPYELKKDEINSTEDL